MHSLAHPLVAIVGPTASGKSALSDRLASCSDIPSIILSTDSMQIYRSMDIGTGKVAPKDRSVPYYGIDIVDPSQSYSAALFQRYGRSVIEHASARGKRCILCGGTGFYLRSVIDDYHYDASDTVDDGCVRKACEDYVVRNGSDGLWKKLEMRDSASAALIHPHDTKRIIRAFELLNSGSSYAQKRKELAHITPYYQSICIGLHVDPDVLNKRIDARVDQMIEEGFVDEVKHLLDLGYGNTATARQAIGYREIADVLHGRMTLDQACNAIKVATHRYAKRQRTWFRKDMRIHWLNADSASIDQLVDSAQSIIVRLK